MDGDDSWIAAGMPLGAGEQSFVVYVEGELAETWQSFAAFGCPDPAPGFSSLRVRAEISADFDCTLESARRVSLRPLPNGGCRTQRLDLLSRRALSTNEVRRRKKVPRLHPAVLIE